MQLYAILREMKFQNLNGSKHKKAIEQKRSLFNTIKNMSKIFHAGLVNNSLSVAIRHQREELKNFNLS